MPFQRAVEIPNGTAMVVTDLHGAGNIYDHLRKIFLDGYKAGELQHWIICGDLIHGNGTAENDHSLRMMLDVMQLQRELGEDVVIMLCGNHEMPHIYGQTLARGTTVYTPRFEHALAKLDADRSSKFSRADVIQFLMKLPFVAFTGAGVLPCHAGPSQAIRTPGEARFMLNFDHRAFLQHVDSELDKYDLDHARQVVGTKYGKPYKEVVSEYLATDDPKDARYNHLLRMFVLNEHPTYDFLWKFLFSRNEQDFPNDLRRAVLYETVVNDYLDSISQMNPALPQHVVVSGHIPVRGGHQVVDDFHLRLATYEHAYPKQSGEYLILDCAKKVEDAEALIPMLRKTVE